MRIAFTIIYEGLHHLKHKEFADKMVKLFDHWIVVEGHARPVGSTRWCKKIDVPATSQDGTIEFMVDFAKKNKNVHFFTNGVYFNGKDEQVNVAIRILRQICKSCYLWQVDADEHWSLQDIEAAELIASKSKNYGFAFQFNQYVGDGLVAKGEWGSGFMNRLWKWSGQAFKSHEPALLIGQRHTENIMGIKYEHYSYVFDKDVKFKSQYYSGHENVFKNLDAVRKSEKYPIHISAMFGKETKIGQSNSFIYKS